MGEREMADLALIKQREAALKQALERGDRSVPIPAAFTSQQLGLRAVWADAHGHLWRYDGDCLTRISALPGKGPVDAGY